MKIKTSRTQSGESEIAGLIAIVFIIAVVAVAIMAGMWLWPKYNVYASSQQGLALLAHAQSSKEVAVAEAKAKMESATLLAQAEVERAKGVAQANKIIGDSLRGNDSYLRYLWIMEVAGHDADKTIVYVPTEGNLPVLEASRLQKSEK